jgi:hypothetical protein
MSTGEERRVGGGRAPGTVEYIAIRLLSLEGPRTVTLDVDIKLTLRVNGLLG